MHKRILKKVLSCFLSFNLLLQGYLPLLLQPAYASQSTSPTLIFSETNHSFAVNSHYTTGSEFALFYKPADKNIQSAISLVPEGLAISDPIFVGSCSSGNKCVFDNAPFIILKLKSSDSFSVVAQKYQFTDRLSLIEESSSNSLDLTDEEIEWLNNPQTDTTFYPVVSLGETYGYQDSNLGLTFTKLPDNPGSLTIKELKLSPEQMAETGSLSDVAYDITSTMTDGSFSYDLTLPLPSSAKDKDVAVKSAETESSLDSATTVSEETQKESDTITIKDLNHFTVFIIVTPLKVATSYVDVSADSSKWFFYNDETDTIDNSLGSFITGPSTPPKGNGSVQISVSGTQRRNLATYGFAGTKLTDITAFAYSTYNPSVGNGGSINRSGYLQFNVTFDGNDTWQNRLIYLPSVNGTVVQNTWQEWDAINGGNALWGWSGYAAYGNKWPDNNTQQYRTVANLISAFPNIGIRQTDSFVGIRVGEPYADGYTENIDDFKFGTAAGITEYNFETSSPNIVYVDDDYTSIFSDGHSWGYDAFTTIREGINAVASGGTVHVLAGDYDETITLSSENDGINILGVAGAKTGSIDVTGATGVTISGIEFTSPSITSVLNISDTSDSSFINNVFNGYYITLSGNLTNSGASQGIIFNNVLGLSTDSDGNIDGINDLTTSPFNIFFNWWGTANPLFSGLTNVDVDKTLIADKDTGNPLAGAINYVGDDGRVEATVGAPNTATLYIAKSTKVAPINLSGILAVGSYYEMTKSNDGSLSGPISITINNSTSLPSKMVPSSLKIYELIGSTWQLASGNVLDGSKITAAISGLNPFVLAGETDNTPPTISIGSGNGNSNTSPIHNTLYNGSVDIYATVTDPHLLNYHFRVIKDGSSDSHNCGNSLGNPENQGYGKCGYIYNQITSQTSDLNNQKIASLDTTKLTDGSYWLIIGAADSFGNRAKPNYLNDPRVKILVDNTAPSTPQNGLPHNSSVATNNFYFTWDSSSDNTPVIYEFQSSKSNSTDSNGSLIGAWNSIKNGNSEQNNLVLPKIHSTGASDGTYFWQVRAIDSVGNKSGWGGVWKATIDTKNPVITVNPFATNDTTPAISGTVDDDTATIKITVSGNTYDATNNGNGTWQLADNTITPALANGTHDIIAKATDGASNVGQDSTSGELTIDNIAPSATLSHYIDSVLFLGSIAKVNNLSKLTFSGNYTDPFPSSGLRQDSFVIFQAQDNGSFAFSANGKRAYCSWRGSANTLSLTGNPAILSDVPFTKCVADLPEGEYYMSHQIYDSAARGTDTVVSQFRDVLGLRFIIDKTAPVITIGSYNTNWTNQDITVTATTNEGTLNAASHTFTSNGSFTFIAIDDAGNSSSETVSITNIDKTAPISQISSPTTATYFNSAITISGTTTDQNGIAHVDLSYANYANEQCGAYSSIDTITPDGSTTNFSWSYPWTPSAQGSYCIKAAGTDIAGNEEHSATVMGITYDTTNPTVSYISPTPKDNLLSNNNDQTFKVSLSEDVSSCSLNFGINNGGFEEGNLSNWNTSGNANWYVNSSYKTEGSYSARSGNMSDWNNVSSTLQRSVTTGADSTLTFWWKVSSESYFDRLYFYLDGSPINYISGNVDWHQQQYSLSSGLHNLQWIYSKDFSVTRDLDAGFVDNVRVSGGSGESQTMTVDNVNHTATLTLTDMSDSIYTYSVNCNDYAGNIGLESTRTLTVDTKTPTLSKQTLFSEGWYNEDQLSTFSYTDENGIKSGTPVTCTISTEGENQTCSITPNVCDNAGNCNTEKVTSNRANIDKANPIVSIATNPANPDADNGWFKTQPEITINVVDKNPRILQYQWDSTDGEWTDFTNAIKPATEGVHTLYYRAFDKADNTSGIISSIIKWDKTPLEFAPQNVSANPNPTSGSTSKIKWEVAKDNIGIDKYEVIWTLNGSNPVSYSLTVGSDILEKEIDKLTEGRWTVIVKAFDGAGNTKESAIDLFVDRSGPTAPILTLTGTGIGSANLSWTNVSDATDYIVWYGLNPGQHLFGARVGNTNSYTINGLGAGTYYFTVKSVDAAQNQSGFSNEVSTITAITGAPGVAPGAQIPGFTPEVLGTDTEATPSAISGQEITPQVLGESDKKSGSWNWLWLLALVPIFLGGKQLFKKD